MLVLMLSYVVHSDFPRSLSDTGSCPLHKSPRSYTEYYSFGLLGEQKTHTHTQTPRATLNSDYIDNAD